MATGNPSEPQPNEIDRWPQFDSVQHQFDLIHRRFDAVTQRLDDVHRLLLWNLLLTGILIATLIGLAIYDWISGQSSFPLP